MYLTITKKRFLEWYFLDATEDQRDALLMNIGRDIENELLEGYDIKYTAKRLFDQTDTNLINFCKCNEFNELIHKDVLLQEVGDYTLELIEDKEAESEEKKGVESLAPNQNIWATLLNKYWEENLEPVFNIARCEWGEDIDTGDTYAWRFKHPSNPSFLWTLKIDKNTHEINLN